MWAGKVVGAKGQAETTQDLSITIKPLDLTAVKQGQGWRALSRAVVADDWSL